MRRGFTPCYYIHLAKKKGRWNAVLTPRGVLEKHEEMMEKTVGARLDNVVKKGYAPPNLGELIGRDLQTAEKYLLENSEIVSTRIAIISRIQDILKNIREREYVITAVRYGWSSNGEVYEREGFMYVAKQPFTVTETYCSWNLLDNAFSKKTFLHHSFEMRWYDILGEVFKLG